MNEPPTMPPAGEEARTRRMRDVALAAYLASSFGFGVIDLLLYYHELWDTFSWALSTLFGIVMVVLWCALDARLRGVTLSLGLRLAIWFVAAIGVPVYLVRSRGWKGAARLGFGVPVFLLGLGLYYAAWYGARWVASTLGYFSA